MAQMGNPWLDISESDYVGHMSSPDVNQRPVLSRLLRDTLESARPETVLVLGCSTGNGLEHVDATVTRRVAGVDLNPTYLRRLIERFPNPAFALDVRCVDLAEYAFEPDAFDLVHAALVLEYVDWLPLLPRFASTLRPRGTLSVVLQRPSVSSPAVTPTAFASLRSLESVFHFVEPDVLVALASDVGLRLDYRRTEPLPSAKGFEVLRFLKVGL
ncbi:MAG: class I SAM-dependent methyltransferase [Vicinamibacterales bacterium]